LIETTPHRIDRVEHAVASHFVERLSDEVGTRTRLFEQVLLGVSTRGYAGNLEAALAKALHKNTPSEAAA